MKLVLDPYNTSNKTMLLVNLIMGRSDLFETPEVSNKYPEHVGDVQITTVRTGQTFEDKIDGEYTTVVEGKALVALNMYENFRLVLCTDGFCTLEHFNKVAPMFGREAQEISITKVSLLIQ